MFLSDPVIEIGEIDITEIVSNCTLTFSRPDVSNQNTFGVKGQRRRVKGLWDGSLAITFHHDWDDDAFSQAAWEWLAGDEVVPFAVRAQDAPISVDNPEWRGYLSVSELPVQDGDPESISSASVTWALDGVPEMVTSEGS